jgi:hypothetical protein
MFIPFVFFSIACLISGCSESSESNPQNKYRIEINSYVVRDRVIPVGCIHMKSTIIVGFRIIPEIENLSDMTIRGELYNNNKLLSEDTIVKLDSNANNLGFDIPLSEGPFSYEKPMSIPDGKYRIVIKLLDAKNHLVAQCQKELNRNQIGRIFYGFDKFYNQPRYILINEEKTDGGSLRLRNQKEDRFAIGSLRSRLEATDNNKNAIGSLRSRLEAKDKKTNNDKQKAKDYIVFQKSYLERIYSNTQPKAEELITELSTEISRNESKPLTFSIRAKKDLGRVKISIATLKDKRGQSSSVDVQVGAVNQLTEVVKEDNKKNIVYYQYAPKIIENKEVAIFQNHTQTYWLTIKTNSDTTPGDYHGSIKINAQSGKPIEMPIQVKVLPLTLTDTDKDYGMMMDYAFYEMDNETWTEKEENILQKRGMEIYRDLRDHGMTVIYPHSYFYYKMDKNGDPILTSLKASMESYKNLQFPGPFVWYLGHLLQTAKTMHPGSILNYDSKVAEKRLRDLLVKFEMMAKELKIPKDKLIVQLVDESDPDQKERTKAGKELHKVAKQLGFKTLITRPWTDVDVICTGIPDNEKQAQQRRNLAKEWWIYPNNALDSKNLAYTRYVFGFGAWRWGVNGVIPWTYQMSQGSNGNPFTVLDGPEIMVAYPGVNGPIPTPIWEAIRDGINDYKYIYLLQQLISSEKKLNNPVAYSLDGKLRQFKQNLGKGPGPEEAEYGDWSPDSFDKRRKQIVEWAMELQKNVGG